ncbi:MAG: hypothetical protein WC683_10310 [bacterium]|jgi:hypothetical protein
MAVEAAIRAASVNITRAICLLVAAQERANLIAAIQATGEPLRPNRFRKLVKGIESSLNDALAMAKASDGADG